MKATSSSLKAAVLNHLNLAAKGLLGRGSIYYKLERLIRVQILYRYCGTQTSRALHMMAAAVSQVAERIVLAKNTKNRAASP